VERLKASDWSRLVVGINDTANKIILLKSLYPRADLTRIVQLAPGTLLEDAATLQDNARQVGVVGRVCVPLSSMPMPASALHISCPATRSHQQVKQLLASAKQPDELLTALPSLLDPHICISIIVTVCSQQFRKQQNSKQA
jgi:hypothetical protein